MRWSNPLPDFSDFWAQVEKEDQDRRKELEQMSELERAQRKARRQDFGFSETWRGKIDKSRDD